MEVIEKYILKASNSQKKCGAVRNVNFYPFTVILVLILYFSRVTYFNDSIYKTFNVERLYLYFSLSCKYGSRFLTEKYFKWVEKGKGDKLCTTHCNYFFIYILGQMMR